MGLEKLTAKKLTAEQTAEVVQTLLREITPMAGLEEARLFGSAARQEMTEASDIDIVLIFDSMENAKQASKTVHNRRAESLRWPADILCVDRATYERKSRIGGVFWMAREDGIIVYPTEAR